jgi:hypothetical protein
MSLVACPCDEMALEKRGLTLMRDVQNQRSNLIFTLCERLLKTPCARWIGRAKKLYSCTGDLRGQKIDRWCIGNCAVVTTSRTPDKEFN